MDFELQDLKQNMLAGKTDVEALLSIFGEDDVESASFDSRSRYKRVDALLKAIQQRPGQLIFNGNVTTIGQLVNNKDDKMETFGTASMDIFATTSFGKGTLLFIDMEAIGGDGPDQIYPSFSGLNGDAGTTQSFDGIDRLNILEAWAEFTMLKESITITAGKVDLTNYFDNNASANDETRQFISKSFINNSSFAVPSNSPGLRIRTTLLKRYHVQFGLASQDNMGSMLLNDLYKIASLGWTFAPGSDFESNLRFYGYQVPVADNSYGWGVSFNKLIFGSYNIFGRFGQNLDSIADYWGIKSSWSAGTRFVKTIANQVLAIGIAYGQNTAYDQSLEKEKIMEIYLMRQINKWAHISPHFQYVWNAKGTQQKFPVFGIRTNFTF